MRRSLFRRLLRRPADALPLACALAAGAAGSAHAQSLIELYNAARPYDATYLAARAQADSAQYRAAQADALRLPSLGLGASYTDSDTDWRTRGATLRTHTTAAALNGRQTVFNRANDATIGQARVLLEASGAELETAEQDLVVRVAQAYFDVLAAQDTLSTARANKQAIGEQLASAKRNFEVGTATITDTREAQARFDLATSQELAADNDLRTKSVVLDQLVGRSNVQPDPLAQPVMLPEPRPADAEAWVNSAWQVHPGIRRAQAGLDNAKLETEKARAGHLPTVELVARFGGQRQRGNAAELPGNSVPATVGVEMNLPLFAGFSVQNRVKETLSLEEKARNDLEAARRAVATATRTAYFQVQSSLAQVRALEAAETSSKLALEATQLGYRVGVRVNLDVLNAQTQLFTTQRDLAFARYNVLLGTLRLKQAAGQLGGEDLLAINALLTR
ncbi:TolC family outer membrane protein [Aquincola sp. MAHUQ-54]|uniref:TolC family outer membrane protein n=1 Tax=Aquincola agrisoli TaxID=3119538 RepID=A0AAW9Q8X4_9BURK